MYRAPHTLTWDLSVSVHDDLILAHYRLLFHPQEMDIRDINQGLDVPGIQVGQNTIVLPISDLQDALNYSSGTIGN